MKEKFTDMLCALGAALIGALVCFLAYRHHGPSEGPETVVITKVDTSYVHDTISVSTPVYVRVRVVDTLRVPVPVPGGRDTVWAELPREEKTYQDSTFRAVVSGVAPSLDTIDIYRKTIYIDRTSTVYVQPPRWSVGLQAGYGATKDGLSPYVGIGVQYRLLDFPSRRK